MNTPTKKKAPVLPIVLAVLVCLGGYFGYKAWYFGQHFEETDDAQIDANIAPVLPRTAGYVQEILVKDNQNVTKGQPLLRIDANELTLAVAQAEGALQNAIAQVEVAKANITSGQAAVATAQANFKTVQGSISSAKVEQWRNEREYQRTKNLYAEKSISQQALDQAQAGAEASTLGVQTASRQLDAAQAQIAVAEAQVAAAKRGLAVAEAGVKTRQSDLELTKLKVGYAEVKAPISGRLGKRNIQLGQFVQAGQTAFNIVQDDSVWATANFKETQIGRMKAGQKVEIKVDAYGDKTFEGVIDSFSSATGSKFALLPPDNSSGNFVKVVQRVPVKILITNMDAAHPLRAGMNIAATVSLD